MCRVSHSCGNHAPVASSSAEPREPTWSPCANWPASEYARTTDTSSEAGWGANAVSFTRTCALWAVWARCSAACVWPRTARTADFICAPMSQASTSAEASRSLGRGSSREAARAGCPDTASMVASFRRSISWAAGLVTWLRAASFTARASLTLAPIQNRLYVRARTAASVSPSSSAWSWASVSTLSACSKLPSSNRASPRRRRLPVV